MSDLKLIDHPLKADEIRIVMDRAVAVAHAGGHTWVTEVDMLTHHGAAAPGSEVRPVDGYSLAFKVPRHGLELDKALKLAQWVSTLLSGRGVAATSSGPTTTAGAPMLAAAGSAAPVATPTRGGGRAGDHRLQQAERSPAVPMSCPSCVSLASKGKTCWRHPAQPDIVINPAPVSGASPTALHKAIKSLIDALNAAPPVKPTPLHPLPLLTKLVHVPTQVAWVIVAVRSKGSAMYGLQDAAGNPMVVHDYEIDYGTYAVVP